MEEIQKIELKPNPAKNLVIEVDGKKYERFPVKTHVVIPGEDFGEVVEKYAKPFLKSGDMLFVGEKAVAISQGRAYPKDQIKPSWLARFLVRFTTKSSIGVGLSSPETMQLAIEDVGIPRILLATVAAGFTKPFGIKGWFYRVAGDKARAIDGAAEYVMPPYNTYVSKGPIDPDGTAEKISQKVGVPVAVVDANDFGVVILGACNSISKENRKLIARIIKDNPLGQTSEQTPIGIIREIPKS